MWLSSVLAVLLSVEMVSAAPYWRRTTYFGSQPVRGVNIGGWLILEPWITPSIFQQFPGTTIVDEYTLCQHAPNAQQILQSHWSSWTGLGDFQKIAGAGFNTVRIPIGYWAFQKYEGDPYIMGAQGYLDQAIGWARQAGLQVVIDLHGETLHHSEGVSSADGVFCFTGAQRSQNGYDNSGQFLSRPGWTTGDSVSATENVMRMIAGKYAAPSYQDVVVAIELLNEPLMSELAGGQGATRAYYQNGFNTVRSVSSTSVVIHDGFQNAAQWNGFLTGQGAAGAIVDHHEYQCFSNADVALSTQQHIGAVCSRAQSWGEGQDKYLIVGEWSGAMTDCAPALNGYGIGARYDGTYAKQNADGTYSGSTYVGSCANRDFVSQWSPQLKTDTANYINAQLDVFEQKTQGWIYWNFKTEAAAEWDLFAQLDAGIFPQLNGRKSTMNCR